MRGEEWQAGQFVLIDTMEEPVRGYWQAGARVFGWAMPVFERDAAMQIMEAVNACNAGYDETTITYDAEHDAFIYREDPRWVSDDAQPVVIAREDVTVGSEVKHVYAIGTGEWTWDTWANYQELAGKP